MYALVLVNKLIHFQGSQFIRFLFFFLSLCYVFNNSISVQGRISCCPFKLCNSLNLANHIDHLTIRISKLLTLPLCSHVTIELTATTTSIQSWLGGSI